VEHSGLATLTKGILQLHPALEKGVNLDRHLNQICTEIIKKWIAKLPSRCARDELTIRPESYERHNSVDGAKPIFISYWLDLPPPVYLQDFVQACACPDIAYEVITGLGQIAYCGLEVWTPDVITDMNSYECWYGEVEDAGFIETFEDMHGEPFDQKEHESMLPSVWYKKLSDEGYVYLHKKPKMTFKKLREYSATASPEEQVLIKALIKIRQEAKKKRMALLSRHFISCGTRKVPTCFCMLLMKLWTGATTLVKVEKLNSKLNLRPDSQLIRL